MGITDDEIDRAVCSVTPTRSATPAPDVLAGMRRAIRSEHRAQLARRLARGIESTATLIGYAVMALAVVALVLEAVGVRL